MIIVNDTKTELDISSNAMTILEERFLWKDPDTRQLIERPEELFERVSSFVALPTKTIGASEYEQQRMSFYNMLSTFKFIPNTPTLSNAGSTSG